MRLILMVMATLAVANAASAMPKPVLPPPVQVAPVPSGVKARAVKLARAVVAMKDGEIWRHEGPPIACGLRGDEYGWIADQSDLKIERFQSVFDDEIVRAGFSKSGSSELFETSELGDGYEVGFRINQIRLYACNSIVGYAVAVVSISGEWQVYDPLRREVVARVTTSGGYDEAKGILSTRVDVVLAGFRENVRALLADQGFRNIVLSSSKTASTATAPGSANTAIILGSAAKPDVARPISDVPGSVVAVFTGSGMGSGFLVSNDGYLLTNHHVVGGATTVRVRWSDGFETTGEVVRVDKRRDVALVKTSPHGRQPLALRRATPGVGDAVFAIGTPLDEKLQGTVTKGIVSANRIIDGFAYIQSDVGVDHGNSGGPLVDDKGRVIGITVIKIAPDDTQRGLNLFIPIGDALDFLSLTTTP
jgi:serine protease Do